MLKCLLILWNLLWRSSYLMSCIDGDDLELPPPAMCLWAVLVTVTVDAVDPVIFHTQ